MTVESQGVEPRGAAAMVAFDGNASALCVPRYVRLAGMVAVVSLGFGNPFTLRRIPKYLNISFSYKVTHQFNVQSPVWWCLGAFFFNYLVTSLHY